MSQIQNQTKKAQYVLSSHHDLIKRNLKETDQSIRRKRKIIYSDIINIIIREDYRGKMFNEINLSCNYKIKQGKYNVVIDYFKF